MMFPLLSLFDKHIIVYQYLQENSSIMSRLRAVVK